jgi:hypothetical protein
MRRAASVGPQHRLVMARPAGKNSVNQLLLGVGGAEPVTLAGDVLFKTDLLTELLHWLADVAFERTGNAPMAKDELVYSEAVRIAAAEAAAALGTNPEAVRQPAIAARGQAGNDESRVSPNTDVQKNKATPRKRPVVQPPDARTITTLEACIADLRSLLAKAEERAAEERSRCDQLLAGALDANARAARLEGELAALRSRPAPWWRRWRQANGA